MELTDFVEAGDDVAEVDPGGPSFCHLVKQVVPEKLQQVAVARLRPRWVFLKPVSHHTGSECVNTTILSRSLWRLVTMKVYLLWPLVDGAQFGQQAEETAVLHLLQINNDFTDCLFFQRMDSERAWGRAGHNPLLNGAIFGPSHWNLGANIWFTEHLQWVWCYCDHFLVAQDLFVLGYDLSLPASRCTGPILSGMRKFLFSGHDRDQKTCR